MLVALGFPRQKWGEQQQHERPFTTAPPQGQHKKVKNIYKEMPNITEGATRMT